MTAKSVGELISAWYARDREEFLAAHPDPVLIGVGILDVKLLRDPRRPGSTLCIGFEQAAVGKDTPPHPLVGAILSIGWATEPAKHQFLVGRAENVDVRIEDRAVSERHCLIERRGQALMVSDLGSTNGTMINGVPLEPPLAHTLRDEDILTIGRYSFQYFTPPVLYQYLQLSPPPH